MSRIRKTVATISGLMGLVGLVASHSAHALPVLTIDDLGTTGIDLIITDNGAAGIATSVGNTNAADGNTDAGWVSYNGSAGGFAVVVTLGLTKPYLPVGGQPNTAELQLNNFVVSGIGQLEVKFTDTDFLIDTGGAPVGSTWVSALSGNSGGSASITFDQYVDTTNAEFGAEHQINHGAFSGNSFNETVWTNVSVNGPFSITERILVDHSSPSDSSSVTFTSRVPEPSTLALLGIGLAAFGFSSRRKR